METNTPSAETSFDNLLLQWERELDNLRRMNELNPVWEWRKVQAGIENLHYLARELEEAKARQQARWQP
ncbi:MAG: hypothetical protein OEZ59_10485 [Deltaproteobacteria bacterium]|nr:hypothetical protein [Deltaproteobacteria bacterium]